MEFRKQEVKIKTYRVDALCPHCKTGVMIVTKKIVRAKISTINSSQMPPALFVHICDSCKAEKPLKEKYPRIVDELIPVSNSEETKDESV